MSRYIHQCSSQRNLTIFQSRKWVRPIPVSLLDVREALEATEKMRQIDRIVYFEARGIDHDNTIKYYEYVHNQTKKIKSGINWFLGIFGLFLVLFS